MTRRLLPLLAACLVAACQGAPPPGAAPASVVAGRASLVLAPTVARGATRRLMAEIAPWDEAAIVHMVVRLYTVDGQGNETDTTQAADIPADELYNGITFTNLNFNMTYRARAFAYKAAGDDAEDLISQASSYVDIVVGTDDRPLMGNLVVNLADRIFSGEATSSGLTVNDGGVVHAGNVGVQLKTSLAFTHLGTYRATVPDGQSKLVANADGDLFYTSSSSGKVYKVPAGGGAAELVIGGLTSPNGLALGADGRLYVGTASQILAVEPDGDATVLAGGSSQGDFPAAGGSAVAGGDARFTGVQGLAFDANGDLIAVDSGNDVLRRVTMAGQVSNLTSRSPSPFLLPNGIVRGRDGRFYVSYRAGKRFYRVTPAGAATVYAGDGATAGDDGPVATASFFDPLGGLAFDAAGALYVCDNYTVRRIDPPGRTVTTLAGRPAFSESTDGTVYQGGGVYGTGRLAAPFSLVVNAAGEVLVGDSGKIRRIYDATP